jgi:hypothetical protein
MQCGADTDLKNGLNAHNTFSGTIKLLLNIGRSADNLVALWNEAHPDNPVAPPAT